MKPAPKPPAETLLDLAQELLKAMDALVPVLPDDMADTIHSIAVTGHRIVAQERAKLQGAA